MIVRNGQRLGSVLVDKVGTEPAAELTETEQEADRQAAEARESQLVEPARERPQRPPASGPGSGNDAWRRYAAAVTESPVESWLSLNRDEIIELLDSEGSESDA